MTFAPRERMRAHAPFDGPLLSCLRLTRLGRPVLLMRQVVDGRNKCGQDAFFSRVRSQKLRLRCALTALSMARWPYCPE